MFCEAHDPSITANKPTMTQQAVACISTLSERKTTIAPKTGIRLSRYYFTIVYNSSSAVRPTKQPAPINSIYRASDTFSEAAHARRGAADCGELRQTAGAFLPLWVKVKNPKAPAFTREAQEDWGALVWELLRNKLHYRAQTHKKAN
jgi:hypothetical protein